MGIESEVRLDGKTGVEMEALTAVAVAAFTMTCRGQDKSMSFEYTSDKKRGGKRMQHSNMEMIREYHIIRAL